MKENVNKFSIYRRWRYWLFLLRLFLPVVRQVKHHVAGEGVADGIVEVEAVLKIIVVDMRQAIIYSTLRV